MTTNLDLGEISVDVVFKDIKNIHLSVYPPTGRVRIAAPRRMSIETIRVYAISKIAWIKRNQGKFMGQERETPREYLERESHYIWGKRYLLHIKEEQQSPFVVLNHDQIVLTVRPGAGKDKRESIVSAWYREQVRQFKEPLIAKWDSIMDVRVEKVIVRQMKTKWGSCSPGKRAIRLNTELAKKPRECLEYIIVHEMTHLLEPTHNEAFIKLMDTFMPQWPHIRDELNRAPLRHVEWEY